MKAILTILAGLVLAVLVFVGGLVAATEMLTTGKEPTRPASRNVSQLWTNEPVKIDTTAQSLERISPRENIVTPSDDSEFRPTNVKMVTLNLPSPTAMNSSSLAPTPTNANTEAATAEPEMSPSHLEWCTNRYRSYRPRDNSYTPFNGGRRPCDSPYSVKATASGDVGSKSQLTSSASSAIDDFKASVKPLGYQGQVVADVRPGTYGTWEHAQSCFSRYRSYRPEDNTYQPVGGGTRRQCQ